MVEQVRTELAEWCGGVTAYLRSPASGVWKDDRGDLARDEVLMFEVMVETIDRTRWSAYRETLEERFDQDEILMRALACQRL